MADLVPLVFYLALLVLSIVALHFGPSIFSVTFPHKQRPKNMASQQQADEPSSALLADTLDPATAHSQLQSPLFTILPPEVRNTIFSLALRSYDDASNPYEKGTFWERPDTSHRLVLDTRLLRACRRVYLETYLLPCFQTERIYWWGRGPTEELSCCNPAHDLQKMTPAHRSRAAVHVFIQQFQLEGSFKRLFLGDYFRPASLKLTLRHTDWWYWEQSAPLCLDPKQNGRPRTFRYVPRDGAFGNSSWGVCLAAVNGLQTFNLELETVSSKKGELDDIVRRAYDWVFPMHDGAFLVCDPNSRKVTEWKGIDRFYELSNETWRPAGWQKGSAPELTYYVVELTWRRTMRDPAKDRLGEEWSTTTHRGVALPLPPPPVYEDESYGLFDLSP